MSLATAPRREVAQQSSKEVYMEELKEHAEASQPDSLVAAPIARPRYGLLAAILLPLAVLIGGVLWYRHSGGEQVTSAVAAKEAPPPAPPTTPGVVVANATHLKQITVEPV